MAIVLASVRSLENSRTGLIYHLYSNCLWLCSPRPWAPPRSTALTLTQLLTFTIFVLFYIPCASTIAGMSRELGWKGAATAAGLSLILALILGMLTRGFRALVF